MSLLTRFGWLQVQLNSLALLLINQEQSIAAAGQILGTHAALGLFVKIAIKAFASPLGLWANKRSLSRAIKLFFP